MEERRKQAALHNWKSLAKFLFTREEVVKSPCRYCPPPLLVDFNVQVQQRFDKQYTRKREERASVSRRTPLPPTDLDSVKANEEQRANSVVNMLPGVQRLWAVAGSRRGREKNNEERDEEDEECGSGRGQIR
eukprot:767647-Hanusia_phi.AAC.3